MNISRAFVQRKRISYSASWTCLPGRLPRTDCQRGTREGEGPSSRRSITESRSGSVCSAMVGQWGKGQAAAHASAIRHTHTGITAARSHHHSQPRAQAQPQDRATLTLLRGQGPVLPCSCDGQRWIGARCSGGARLLEQATRAGPLADGRVATQGCGQGGVFTGASDSRQCAALAQAALQVKRGRGQAGILRYSTTTPLF
jgi:hypothetical protein